MERIELGEVLQTSAGVQLFANVLEASGVPGNYQYLGSTGLRLDGRFHPTGVSINGGTPKWMVDDG